MLVNFRQECVYQAFRGPPGQMELFFANWMSAGGAKTSAKKDASAVSKVTDSSSEQQPSAGKMGSRAEQVQTGA